MPKFIVTYWVEENHQRGACGGLGAWAGAHNVIVEAKTFAKALEECAPAGDCYRMEIAPIHRDHTAKEEE
jgi:hypothetical protein